jgi:serine/threonine protein kinase
MDALLLEKRRFDQTEGVLEAKSAHDTFADLFEFAPTPVPEWVLIQGEDFADDDEEERALLGTGSFASTYRVSARAGAALEGIRAGSLFAAKVVELKTLKRMGLGKEVVLREARALRELRHRHVVRFLGLFEDKKKFYIVMELAGGGSLAARLPPMTLAGPALPDVRRWVRQLAGAVEYIHGMDVFHRDIKPENVLLSERGRAPLSGEQRGPCRVPCFAPHAPSLPLPRACANHES